MKEQTKAKLQVILSDSEKITAFVSTILEMIQTDDDDLEDIGISIIDALLEDDADALLTALCGWTAESVLNISGNGLPYSEEMP